MCSLLLLSSGASRIVLRLTEAAFWWVLFQKLLDYEVDSDEEWEEEEPGESLSHSEGVRFLCDGKRAFGEQLRLSVWLLKSKVYF